MSTARASDITTAMPVLTPDLTFDEACRLVVDYLHDEVPLGYWAVTRYDGEQQIHLEARSDMPGLDTGLTVPWADTLCSRMSLGRGPQLAPDAMAVPAYAESDAARELGVGTYVGIPIQRPDRELFGTLCGLDPAVQDETFTRHAPLLQLLGSLLSMVLAADLARAELERERTQARTEATTDALTGLLNRRGWDRAIEVAEARWRRFGDPGALLVIDLDDLKRRNDTEGHAAGDAYLVRTAEVLRGALRMYDQLARIGGDEFAVAVSGLTTAETDALVSRLRTSLAEAGIAAAVGHARYDLSGGSAVTFEAADAAMYADKRRRRAVQGLPPPPPS